MPWRTHVPSIWGNSRRDDQLGTRWLSWIFDKRWIGGNGPISSSWPLGMPTLATFTRYQTDAGGRTTYSESGLGIENIEITPLYGTTHVRRWQTTSRHFIAEDHPTNGIGLLPRSQRYPPSSNNTDPVPSHSKRSTRLLGV